MTSFKSVFLGLFLVGCVDRNPNFCERNGDCRDAAKPFCDVDGKYPESTFVKNSCSAEPADCELADCPCDEGAARCEGAELLVCDPGGMSETATTCTGGCANAECLCTAGAARCDGDTLYTCEADGAGETMEACALGCSTVASPNACKQIVPSYGVGAAFALPGQTDVVIPDDSVINDATGKIRNVLGDEIVVPSMLVPQIGGPSIRVYAAKSFTLGNVRVGSGTGASSTIGAPVAFVATGAITINGLVDASANGLTGHIGTCSDANMIFVSRNGGAGGAGHATRGGSGGGETPVTPGGAIRASHPRLEGGCRGGRITNSAGGLQVDGGGGGGALQLVATTVTFGAQGVLHVGGGTSVATGGGGGAGGLVLIECSQVEMGGGSSGIAANGGSANGCTGGSDATPNTTPATPPPQTGLCFGYFGSAGGTGTVLPVDGFVCAGCGAIATGYPGGGGAAGVAIVRTLAGTFDLGGAFVSAKLEQGVVTLQ